jgi:CHASE2 domain-containing sensor protein
MTETGTKPSTLAAATGRWRDRLLDAAVITIPTALVTQSVNWVQGRFFAQPWQILWIAVPLAMAAFIAWKLLRHPGARRIDWRFGLFLALYATIFAVASGSELLVWKRAAIARSTDEGESGRGWLLPATAGDWRYRLLPKEELPPGFRVVILDHGVGSDETKIAKRVLDAQIIDSARRSGARGVFFDVAFEGHTVADPILCAAVNEAAAAGMPIVTAYALRPFRETGIYVERPEASASQTPACLLESAGRPVYRAHAMVLADGDSVVRSVPIEWEPAAGRLPLSVRIAHCVTAKAGRPPCDSTEFAQPAGPLLRVIPTAMEKRVIAGDENVRALFQAEKPFAGQFLFVGEKSPGDQFKTPGDPLTPGVLIHASAVATLVNGDPIQRPPAWFSAFIVIAACVVLALFAAQGASPLKLLTVAAVSTLVAFGLAAVAIMQFRVWVDVIYTVVAVWLLLPLLLAYRKFAEPRPVAAAIIEQGVSPS